MGMCDAHTMAKTHYIPGRHLEYSEVSRSISKFGRVKIDDEG
jgi:hypothetical protein